MDFSAQGTAQQNNYDQELATALEGVVPLPEPTSPAPAVTPAAAPSDASALPPLPSDAPAVSPLSFEETPAPAPATTTPASSGNSNLDSIKKDALNDLRPLIDKVTLPPEEKFDTYLMLIRSTDDSALVGPAYAAAQAITDEKKRAEALLEIIKEIDYLSHGSQPAPQQ